jgi:hypothetical protein
VSTERCRNCGYRIPTEATICPGCARAHRSARRRELPLPRRSRLLRIARWTRRILIATGWLALVAGVASLARFVVGRERVAEELSVRTLDRVGDVAHDLAIAALCAGVLSLAALWTWAARARRNLRALDLERRWGAPWSLSGWLVPGERARRGRLGVDDLWRDRSPILASLPGAGWSRRPVSLVVLHWWTPWAGVPAVAALLAVVVGGPGELGGSLGLVGVAGAAFAVASVRALYDIVGVVTFAQAHRAERVQRNHDLVRWMVGGEDDDLLEAEPRTAATTVEHDDVLDDDDDVDDGVAADEDAVTDADDGDLAPLRR